MIRVTVDSRCQGHGLCYLRFSDLFEPDDESFASVIVELVGDDRRADLLGAVEGCPERAITALDATIGSGVTAD